MEDISRGWQTRIGSHRFSKILDARWAGCMVVFPSQPWFLWILLICACACTGALVDCSRSFCRFIFILIVTMHVLRIALCAFCFALEHNMNVTRHESTERRAPPILIPLELSRALAVSPIKYFVQTSNGSAGTRRNQISIPMPRVSQWISFHREPAGKR